ncbi:MAG: pyridoxamine 5'-phosphate oxidase [Alphaproteobacteria bacterium]|nr:pyridoxamine 5'-phosphate oxidase [Alphaproteobacteria bacterium]
MMDRLPENPLILFNNWMEQAKEQELNDPEAMALATCTKSGHPSVRIVLLKSFDEKGFKFHSNAESQKGQEIAENVLAALCFHWKSLRKQVRIEGHIEMASQKEADEYFVGRPYMRKIGAHASAQSRPLDSREFLEQKLEELKKLYPEGSDVPRPDYWVGYLVVPEKIEFWWDNPDRLHDRIVYTKDNQANWNQQRLYP